MQKSEFEKRGGRWRRRWQETQARGAGRGSHVPGGGPCWRRLAPLRPSEQPHSSGFPTHSPSKRPQSPSFSRAPPPPLAGEAIFHPLLVFNLLWEKKAAFVERGAARGAGRRRGRLCVPQLRASAGVGAAGVQAVSSGCQGRWARAVGAARSRGAGREGGLGTARVRVAGAEGGSGEGMEEKAPGVFFWPGYCMKTVSHGAGHI